MSQNCPKGFRWEPSLQKCIPILESPVFLKCAPGFHKDPVTQDCVPNLPPNPPPPPPSHPPPVAQLMTFCEVSDQQPDATAKKIFEMIKQEKPDFLVFAGDMTHDDNSTKAGTDNLDSTGLNKDTQIGVAKGNHEGVEANGEAGGKEEEAWKSNLAKGMGGGPWTQSYHIKNCYFIIMNCQDQDYSYAGRTQYNWVKAELEKAMSLRTAGKVDWIFVAQHKPLYTLKSNHVSELKARDVYQPLFDKAQVDFHFAGHTHTMQSWFPMAYNAKKTVSISPNKKSFDFSKVHGQIYNICGGGGRRLASIPAAEKNNQNVMFADAQYGYQVFYIKGRQLTYQYKDIDGKVLFQASCDRTGGIVSPTPAAAPKPSTAPAPAATMTAGQLDQFGIKWLVAKGKQTTIAQTRDTADDDRWSGNVTGLANGFEATFIGKSIGIAEDGHFAMKQYGGNHSKGDWQNQRWYDTGLRSDGTIQLQWEGPHPTNHDFTLPDTKQFIKKISKGLEGNWIGLKWCCQKVKSTPNGSPANGGVRVRMWVDEDAINTTNGKPNNNWKLAFDFVDGVDAKVIQPQTFSAPDEQDCEVRRSGTKSHQVHGGGLHVRALL